MQQSIRDRFTEAWNEYFQGASLPVVFWYAESAPCDLVEPKHCVIPAIQRARLGETVVLSKETIHCFGAQAYVGFDPEAHEPSKEGEPFSFVERFLSTGVEGVVPGEHSKRSPKVCRDLYRRTDSYEAPGRFLIFKRWDLLEEQDDPSVAIFFVEPDSLCGLYNLASYDSGDPNKVIVPWGSGCSSIITDPYIQCKSPDPKAVIGMLDVMARRYCKPNELSFSLPVERLLELLDFMSESFLSTDAWKALEHRMARSHDRAHEG